MDRLVDALAAHDVRDMVRLSPPGFGAPVPDTFDATWAAYRDWLITELERIGGPVHLVGHDWGGGHVVNVAMARPDLLRSWVSDVVGVFDVEYVWHDLARQWQTTGVGEESVAAFAGASVHDRVAYLADAGMDVAIAHKVAPAFDQAMGECILALYRSAAQPTLAGLGAHLESASARPGLAVIASDDQMVGSDEQRLRAARRAGARVARLDGLGHWWMTVAPERGARHLLDFWTAIDNESESKTA